MRKTYKIFGRRVQINLLTENKVQKKTILQHFDLYDKINENNKADFIINIKNEESNKEINTQNPKIHIETTNGFICIYPKISVRFRKQELLEADIYSEYQKPGLKKYLKRLYNIQYNTIDQRISQILHELVLVPSVYFNNKNFLVHSSAFKKPGGKAVLIGGTGGSGKTSLEIELCMNRNYSFIADDISVLDSEGNVFPNLSFPKIYAYNLKNNDVLKKIIFKNRSFADKLAWKLKYLLNGSSGVRRNISPEEVYGKFEKHEVLVEKYYILLKKNTDKINIEKINAKQASEMTISIIQAEYWQFNNHILWHEFNRKAINKQPILNLNEVLSNWKKESEKVFSNIDCYIINIPLHIEHKKFITEVADLII